MGKAKCTDDTVKSAIADYLAGGTMEAVGTKYGMTRAWVGFILRRAKIKARPRGSTIKYRIDHHFFDTIDSHEKAICLGFIWADGCITGKIKHLAITLSKEDAPYLEWMNCMMKNERPVHVYERFACLVAYHPQIVQGLYKCGVYERKSSTIGFPTTEQVPDEYLSSFVLGVFEGDGSIGMTKKTGWCNICGTEVFCKWLQSLIKERLGFETSINYTPTKAGPPLARIVIGGNRQIIQFMEWMYSHAPHKMKRKYERYLQIRALYDADMTRLYSEDERASRTAHRRATRSRWTLSDAALKTMGRRISFELTSPTGDVIRAKSVKAFCREHDLSEASVHKLIQGKREDMKGWRLAPAATLTPATPLAPVLPIAPAIAA